MSFWAHLEALRWTLMRILIGYGLLVAVCFIFMPAIFSDVIMAPAGSDFILYRWLNGLSGDGTLVPDFSRDFRVSIISIQLTSQFMTHISTALWLAFLLIFPYLVGELWLFIRPGLYRRERRGVAAMLLFGIPMFYLGCAVGYFIVFPFTFRFLAMYQLSADIPNMISLDSYIGTFIMLIFVMGVVFQLPAVTWLLSKMELITARLLRTYRRHAGVILLILAAIIPPTGDPFTLLIVFLPLYLLYELSILLSRRPRSPR